MEVTTEPSAKGRLMESAKDFLAGWIGGMAQVLSGQPFDTIKLRLQTSTTTDTPLHCLRRTINNEGFSALYKGTMTPLLGVGLCVSIQFASYEWAKRLFQSQNAANGYSSLTSLQLFAAGAFSGSANSIIAGPIEHIRIRLQIQNSHSLQPKSGPISIARSLLSEGGLKGLYKGQFVTLVREIQGYGLYFTVYEYLAQQSRSKTPSQMLSPLESISYGALAGLAFWIPSFPIDVVKTKLQADSIAAPKYTGAWDCVLKTWKEGKLRAFYKGFTPCLLRAAPVNAATFVVYEYASQFLRE